MIATLLWLNTQECFNMTLINAAALLNDQLKWNCRTMKIIGLTGQLVPSFNPLKSNSHASKNTRWHFSDLQDLHVPRISWHSYLLAALELKLQWQWNVARNVPDCFATLLEPWNRSSIRKWVLTKNLKVVMSDDNPPGLDTKSVVEILSLILTLPSVQTKIRSQIICR